MRENRTKPTDAGIEEYIASRASDQQRADCEALMTLLGRVTGETPRMWGPSIVADLDGSVLEQLVINSVAEVRRRHGA